MKTNSIIAIALSLLLAGCSRQDEDEQKNTTNEQWVSSPEELAAADATTCRAAFLDYMNRKAWLMGMHQTRFADASGYVADGSAITPHDAILLAMKAQSCAAIAGVWGKKQHAMHVGGPQARIDTIASLSKAVFTERYKLLGCKTGTLGGQAGVILLCQGTKGDLYAASILGSVHEQRWRDARRLIDMAERRATAFNVPAADGDLRAQGAAVCRMPMVYVPWMRRILPAWLYQRNVDRPLLPASVTKTMTAICMLDFVDNLDEKFTIEESDLMPGSGPRFKAGDVLSYREALYAMFLPSSNTAAVAVAHAVGRKIILSSH